MVEGLSVEEELAWGGSWLGAARTWIQWNVPNGDTVAWGGNSEVTLTIKQLEDMALAVAVAAIKKERERR